MTSSAMITISKMVTFSSAAKPQYRPPHRESRPTKAVFSFGAECERPVDTHTTKEQYNIDSFELVIPTHHFAEIGKMVGDTAMDLPEQFALGAVQPALRSVVLRGKHARVGRADIVQRDAARRAEQVDTLSAHRSIDKADHYARDNVGIMKPPDVTWWPWLLLTGLLVGTIIIIWLKERGK